MRGFEGMMRWISMPAAALAWAAFTGSASGCESPSGTEIPGTPTAVLEPRAANEAPAADEVKLTVATFDEMIATIKGMKASKPGTKYILVDAWATWCGPCMENFPHVVEMHEKYGTKGLAVASLSMDDPDNAKDRATAEKFLKEQKAVFTNFLAADTNEAFDKLDIRSIPAVFVFSTDGKIVKRFTMDDVDTQFTYEQVEKEIQKLLGAGGAE